MEITAPARIDELESVRGVAAFLVVIFHMPQWYPPFHAFPLIRNGGFMVDLFFVLSGYVICRAYGTTLASPRDVLRFQALRFGRLFPIHLVFVLVFLAIEIGRAWVAHTQAAPLSSVPPFAENSFVALGLQLLLAQAWGPPRYWGTFNGPAWSISVEFYGYLLFAIVALFAQRSKTIAFAILFALGSIMLAAGLVENTNVSRFLCGFFAGCLVCELQGSMPKCGASVQFLALLALAAAIVFKPDQAFSVVIVVLASAFFVSALANGIESGLKRLLRSALMVKLGTLSYSIYMSHFFVIYFATQGVNRLSNAPRALVDGNVIPQPGPAVALALASAVILLTICLSTIIHRWIEYPMRLASREWVARKLGDRALNSQF